MEQKERAVVLVLFFGILLCLPSLARSAELSAEEVATRLQKMYESTQDFKAAFTQRYSSKALGRKKTSSGFVYVKKPGMMRWDYQKPRKKHFVADGKALYIYDPDLEQVMVDRSFSGSSLSTAVTFLWGKGSLQDGFAVKFGERKDLAGPDRYVLELKPKKKARFKRVWFVVEREKFRVLETLIEDPGGNINRVSFSKMKVNVGLTAAAFRFEIPEGIELIEAPGR